MDGTARYSSGSENLNIPVYSRSQTEVKPRKAPVRKRKPKQAKQPAKAKQPVKAKPVRKAKQPKTNF